MIKTYEGTLFHPDLRDAEIQIRIMDGVKYTGGNEIGKMEYTGVVSWDLVSGGSEADEIESELDANSVDDLHEYLVLHFENGETATFRNSYVDMFID